MSHVIHPVVHAKQFVRLIEAVRAGSTIAFDLETRNDVDNLNPRHPGSRLVSNSLTIPGPHAEETFVMACSHPAAGWDGRWRLLATALARAMGDSRLVAHNAAFDIKWLREMTGVDLSGQVTWDTMVCAHLLDENGSKSLKTRAMEDLGVDSWADVDLSDSEQIPWDDLVAYNALDTIHTLALQRLQKQALQDQRGLARLWAKVVMPACRTLIRMEDTGLLLDVDKVSELAVTHAGEYDEVTRRITELAPPDLLAEHSFTKTGRPRELKWGASSKWFHALMASFHQPIEMTPSGRPCWDRRVLRQLEVQGSPIAGLVLEQRRHSKLLSSFLERWPDEADEQGRIHASYKMHGTVTGRLSCEKPNLQQVDRSLKGCFRAPAGHLFCQIDYSQIELRAVAHIADDRVMIDAYGNGDDLHRLTAANVAGVPLDEVTKQQRQQAKAVNFGLIYGMGWRGLQDYARDTYGVVFTNQQAQHARTTFFRLYSSLLGWHERQRHLVYQDAQVRSPLGRIRRLPDIRSKDAARKASAERMAINSPVQSFASDLMLMALARLDEAAGDLGIRLVGTVHDSVLLEVEESRAQDSIEAAMRIMVHPPLRQWFGFDLKVPLEVEAEVGPAWSEVSDVLTCSSGRPAGQ